MILKYGNIELPVYKGCSVKKSSQDIVYSDIKCDYLGHTKEELPERYQEVQLIENNKIIAIGYIESFEFDNLRETDIDLDISFTLLSPKKLATLKTAIAIGTFKLNDLLQLVLDPLINEGFVIQEIDIGNNQVTVNFLAETVEYCMNNLSSKYNFWWYIDENKNIYIKNIENMLKGKEKYIYDNMHSIKGLEYIKPITNSDNYANVIIFKNVRVYEKTFYNEGEPSKTEKPLLKDYNINIKNFDTIEFDYPIDIKNPHLNEEDNGVTTFFYIRYKYTDNSTNYASIVYDNGTISFENCEVENDNIEISLIRDSFFKNLVVGFRFNNSDKTIKEITYLSSDNILVYTINKIYNDKGIYTKKGKISKTGIVEKIINMNESWKTKEELIEIASSYINKNSFAFADEIQMQLDENVFNIGDIIKINKLMVDGVYIVTTINIQDNEEYLVTLKNANMLNNFIDVFRGEPEQVSETKAYNILVTHYSEEEILEKHEVVR